jgi:hypothetical protein
VDAVTGRSISQDGNHAQEHAEQHASHSHHILINEKLTEKYLML